MLYAPYLGGAEEKWVNENEPLVDGCSAESSRQAKTTHSLVGGFHRRQSLTTIRTEVINAAINFLEQRMDNEQEGIMKNIVAICSAKSVNEFLAASTPLLECAGIIGGEVKEFTDTVFEILRF